MLKIGHHRGEAERTEREIPGVLGVGAVTTAAGVSATIQ
jgi:hypothetical protein